MKTNNSSDLDWLRNEYSISQFEKAAVKKHERFFVAVKTFFGLSVIAFLLIVMQLI